MRHWYEVLNKGKAVFMVAIDDFCSTNYVIHNRFGANIRGLNDVKQFLGGFADAFPDLHFNTDDMVAEGDRIVARNTWTGTNKGAFMGIPATNKKVTFWTIEIDRIANGKIVEAWVRMDTLGLMQQLGVIATPKK